MVALWVGGAALGRRQIDEDTGPTAATLEEGFTALFGSWLGLAIGAAAVAAVARAGRFRAGLLACGLGYLFASGVLVLTRPSDVSVGEEVGAVVFFAFPTLAVAAAGAGIGARVGSAVRG
jgi:hypothetical protein